MSDKTDDNVFEQGLAEIIEALEDHTTEEVHWVLSAMAGIGSIDDFDEKEESILLTIEGVLGQFSADAAQSLVQLALSHYHSIMEYERHISEQRRLH